MRISSLDPGDAKRHKEIAREASEVLRAGGLVVFPTETVYGVAASALSERGVSHLRQLKRADASRAFTVHIPGPDAIDRFANLSGASRRLADKAMPGPITLLVEVSPNLQHEKLAALGIPTEEANRIYHDGVVGLRCPDHPLGQIVLEAGGKAVIATSANLKGERPPVTAKQAVQAVGEHVELVIDGGKSKHAKPSTIIKVTGEGADQIWHLQREGVYNKRYIDKLVRYTLLIVCTGNTCRSPMAEGLARCLIAERLGVCSAALSEAGIVVKSAGVHAFDGAPASPEAVSAVASMGIDIQNHRSSPLTPQLIHEADVIYCLTDGHRQAVLSISPDASSKTHRLDPDADVMDPIGMDDSVYQATAKAIKQSLTERLKELPL